jgi:hypothetical protein
MLFSELNEREALEAQWLELTRLSLPGVALSRKWPIVNDHCFQRVLLDNACNAHWATVITGKPAYRHAPDATLRAAVELGMAVLAGTQDITILNNRSLVWRRQQGSVPKQPRF